MFNKKFFRGGFVLIEFAIALPLLILLGWGLAKVGVNIFHLGKTQLADYVLEAEAQYVMERIIHQARVAKNVEFDNPSNQIKFVYHTVNDRSNTVEMNTDANGRYWLFTVADVQETQYFIPHKDNERGIYDTLNAKRQSTGALSNPITGKNSFGETKINSLKFSLDKTKKILHISLEMQSLVSSRKIKLNTAVFMPAYEP